MAHCRRCGQQHISHVLCPHCFGFNNYWRTKSKPAPPQQLRRGPEA